MKFIIFATAAAVLVSIGILIGGAEEIRQRKASLHRLLQESWMRRNADEEDAFRRKLAREQVFRSYTRGEDTQ